MEMINLSLSLCMISVSLCLVSVFVFLSVSVFFFKLQDNVAISNFYTFPVNMLMQIVGEMRLHHCSNLSLSLSLSLSVFSGRRRRKVEMLKKNL